MHIANVISTSTQAHQTQALTRRGPDQGTYVHTEETMAAGMCPAEQSDWA